MCERDWKIKNYMTYQGLLEGKCVGYIIRFWLSGPFQSTAIIIGPLRPLVAVQLLHTTS